MTFSGLQRVESGVLAHTLDAMMEPIWSSTTNTRHPKSQHLEGHQALSERQTSPSFIFLFIF
jgi:hypothetical protein